MKSLAFLCILEGLCLSLPAQDVSLDKKLGAENAALIEQEMGFYQHDSLARLVNAVGQKLVSRLRTNPFEFRFFLVDSPEPNAFALPGGYVYVTRGILAIIQTEDELAGVMAHEIIHVTQRHSVKQLRRGVLPTILKVPGNLINTVTGTGIGNVLNVPIGLTSGAFVAHYSRGHESESDAFGIQLAASAGYKTDALADALERLSKAIAMLTGEEEERNYFSDHPFTPSRVAAIRKSAGQFKPVNPSPVSSSRLDFLKNFSGLCFGQNPEQGIFRDSLFVHPDLGFSWTVPPGWHTANKPIAVSSFPESGDAAVTLRIEGEKKTPREIGEEVKARAEKTANTTVTASGDTTVNGLSAYRIRLAVADKQKATVAEFIWVDFQGNVYQLAGIGQVSAQRAIHAALCSFRKASAGEIQMVKLYAFRIVTAGRNESLSRLAERAGNKLNLELVALANDATLSGALPEGTPIKIICAYPYPAKKGK